MERDLRILLLEDVPEDAELLKFELRRWRLAFKLVRVDSESGFIEELRERKPDIILSDYLLPGFNGITALRIAKELAPGIPFILVTGSMSEEVAVDCMKSGASDYILKNQLPRLEHAIKGALEHSQALNERELAEEARRLAEANFQRIFENSPAGIFQTGLNGEFIAVNRAYAGMFGYESAEEMISAFHEQVHESFATREAGARFRSLLEMQDSIQGFEAEMRRRDGTIFWALTNARAVRDAEGSMMYFEGTCVDVTERKLSEAILRENERRWREMLDNMQLAVINRNPWGQLEYINPFFCQLTGFTLGEAFGKDWFEHFVPEPERRQARQAFAAKIAARGAVHSTAVLLTKTGEKEIAWNHTILQDPGGVVTGVLSIGEDITERKHLEAQLRQAQKMEAVGRLAGGIAHDFNNLLTAITGYSNLLLGEMSEHDPRRAEMLEIRQAGQRAAALTRQLLAFSRKQVMQPRVIDLNALIRDLHKMLQRLIGEDIEMQIALAPDLGKIKADPGQIEQVIMNLAVNSRDAMPNGGKLRLETSNLDLGEDDLRRRAGLSQSTLVRLVVSDTGTGMGAEVLTHIFEPFFTTKDQGKGTGLGLSTVYGIVKQSGGDIDVTSQEGLGTTFEIVLPRCREENAFQPAPEPPKGGLAGTETVLLVEDDEAVRSLVSRVLERNGYRVLEARGPGEAVLITHQHGGRIDLLITDLVMPLMNGRELSIQLRPARPEMKVLFISGYTDDMAMRQGIIDQQMPFIQKPFVPNVLLQKVRELLDGVKAV